MSELIDFRNDKVFLYSDNILWHEATNNIFHIYDNNHRSYYIKFKSGKKYYFSYNNVVILKNAKNIDIDSCVLNKYFNCNDAKLYLSNDNFYLFDNEKGIKQIPNKVIELLIKKIKYNKSLFNYFYYLSKISDMDNNLLESYYLNIKNKWNDDNLLSDIINKNIKRNQYSDFIFPFNYNKSQKEAIIQGLTNNISIIKGPPGTGKTQTILNIIANIVFQDKTVAIISNNNRAVFNVYEKMKDFGYDFLCASLGNMENRELFFSKDEHHCKFDIKESSDNYDELNQLENKIFDCENKIYSLVSKKEELEQQLDKFKKNNNFEIVKIKEKIPTENILKLAIQLETKGKIKLNIFQRIYLKIYYGIKDITFQNDVPKFTERLKNTYILKKLNEIKEQIEKYNNLIKQYKENKVSERIIEISKNKFNSFLNEKNPNYYTYTIDNYKKMFNSFIRKYPIILSSSYCLSSSVPNDFMFDYIVIDEGSQSTITTILPSLIKGKNIIVIGDDKQLPPVITDKFLALEKSLAEKYNIEDDIRDNGKSFLSFLEHYLKGKVKITLLKEHYRCAKEIIDFSNKRFYASQLELRKIDDQIDHLSIIKTVPGNHARKDMISGSGQYNQREIDEIVNLVKKLPSNKSIGVITPYRRQALILRDVLNDNIEVGTIHTFQGREEDIIIFSTVANDIEEYIVNEEVIKSFVDNDQLINVAVTRAKEQFILVTSDKIYNSKKGVLADLIKYIRYQKNSEISEGKVQSIFDILYSDYSELREKVCNNKELLSEKVVEKLINEVLTMNLFSSLNYSTHVPLKTILKIDKDVFSDDVINYLMHPWTHLDFVIFNKYDKIPILAIEVDGIYYHEQNKKQCLHDKMKDECLQKYGIPLLRLKTNESNERERIISLLKNIIYE